MDRRCFGKIIFASILCLYVGENTAWGACPLADKYQEEKNQKMYIDSLNICALRYNDDESQMKLAVMYMKGDGVDQDEAESLYMYQLAAEAGNAEAQVKLSEILRSFDTSHERREKLKEYQKQLEKIDGDSDSFKGEIQHPYTLLMLASERSENKWYYPSQNRVAPARATAMLSAYDISPEKKQMAIKDASRWKTRKLLKTAKEVLSDEEYPIFEERLKDKATRTEAMAELKERVEKHMAMIQEERARP